MIEEIDLSTNQFLSNPSLDTLVVTGKRSTMDDDVGETQNDPD